MEKRKDQHHLPKQCGICGSDDVSVYGPFAELGMNAECHACGAQYWQKSGWIDPEEL